MIKQLFIQSDGPSDWKKKLSNQNRQWKRGKSAFEAAISWENASRSIYGLPTRIRNRLKNVTELKDATLLLGIIEHKVSLKSSGHSSQSDLWGLLKTNIGLVSMSVEAKAGEPFGQNIEQWLNKDKKKSGRQKRLEFLREVLMIEHKIPSDIKYQLIHRTASAILEAERFKTKAALMVVQSFLPDAKALDDFRKFSNLMGAEIGKNEIRQVKRICGIPLFLCWVECSLASDRQVARAIQ